MSQELWARLGRRAAARSGIFTVADAVEEGLSRAELSRKNASGVIERLHRGVYRFPAAASSPMGEVLAAVLAGGPSCVASHTTAAALWGIGDHEISPPHHLLSHGRCSRQIAGAVVHVSHNLARIDLTRLGLIPVTAPWRTTVDVCGILACGEEDLDRAEDLVIEVLRRGLAKEHQLRQVLERMRNAPGTAVVRTVLDTMDPDELRRLLSWLEQYFLRCIAKAGLPKPEVNVRLHGPDGQLVAKVDFIWPWARLVVEVDGLRWHSLPSQKLHDDDRQNGIVLSGRRVLRFGAKKLRESPDEVMEIVARALATA